MRNHGMARLCPTTKLTPLYPYMYKYRRRHTDLGTERDTDIEKGTDTDIDRKLSP